MRYTIAHLYRYPVKGLSAEALASTELTCGAGIPFDRAFGIALPGAQVDASAPQWLPKSNFATLMRHERLAALDARFDEKAGVLSLYRSGKPVARGAVRTPVGRAMLEEFFGAYLKNELAGAPRLVGSPEAPMLSDHPRPGLTIIGLATIADLERVLGRPVDPLRFRANLYLQGTPAWAEFDWVGREVLAGSARLNVAERIGRCAATNVEPGTGRRDMAIPQTLERAFGHADCGVLATVVGDGSLAPGDSLTLV